MTTNAHSTLRCIPKAKDISSKDGRAVTDLPSIWSLKLDGVSCTFANYGKRYGIDVFSRLGNNWIPALHKTDIYQHLAKVLQPGEAVTGELYLPDGNSSACMSYLASNANALKFAAWCLPHSPALVPMCTVQEICEISYGVSVVQWGYTAAGLPFDMVDTAVPQGIEGYMFRESNLTGYVKWKPIRTADLIVSGFTEGKGKYTGKIGAIVCKTSEGTEVAAVSGMTDRERDIITSNTAYFMGKVIEVEYQYVGANGRLVFPRFVRQRTDKLPEQCTDAQFVRPTSFENTGLSPI